MMLLLGYENLDKERLDNANLFSDYPRGQGRTFKYMMHMLSCAHVCESGSRYLYIGENAHHARDLMRDFYEILNREGFTVEHPRDSSRVRIVSPVQVDFYFAPPTDVYRFTQGPLWTDVFIDLTHRRKSRYGRQIHELEHKVVKT